jgi:hypothetical protein
MGWLCQGFGEDVYIYALKVRMICELIFYVIAILKTSPFTFRSSNIRSQKDNREPNFERY